MKYLFVIFYIISSLISNCQTIVWQKGVHDIDIGTRVSILEDKKGTLNIVDITDNAFKTPFHPSQQSILQFGFTYSTYWIRFDVQNESNDSLLLLLQHAFIPSATLYYRDSVGGWNIINSGYTIPLYRKKIIDHFQLYPLLQNNSTYYLQLKPYVHAIPIHIIEKNYWHLIAARQKISYGVYAGILLFAVIINIFLFFALRKAYFLNYSLLVFFYLLTSALVMEGYAVYFFPTVDLMFWYKIVPVLDMPALLFYCIAFFQLKKLHKREYKIAFISATFFIVYLFILHLLPLMHVLLINQVFALFVFALGIRIGLVVGKSGNRLGYFFAIAYTIWFLFILLEAIYIQTGTPKHFSDLSYVSTAIFIEAFLLAFLQAQRFQWEKKAYDLQQFEMKNQINKMEEDFQQELLRTQLEIQEQTFKTVSQEIHDNIGQMLSLAKLNLNRVESNIEDKNAEKIKDAKELVSKSIQDLRDLSKTLNTDTIASIGLIKALELELQQLQKTETVQTSFDVQGALIRMDAQKELILFRITQEAIHNIIKHANASRVVITVAFNPSCFELTIIDDGDGFDSAVRDGLGSGLRNMQSRSQLIGAAWNIFSSPSRGTRIHIQLPIDNKSELIL